MAYEQRNRKDCRSCSVLARTATSFTMTDMQTRANNALAWLLTAGLVVCGASLAYQYSLLMSFRDQMEVHRAHISQLELALEIEKNISVSLSRARLNSLQPGIYVLKSKTAYTVEISEIPEYEITHLTVDVGIEAYIKRVHIGVAMSGFLPKGIYFDYDNDGRADGDMVIEFADEIPVVGATLVSAYDVDIAQNLYTIFLSESEDADFTSFAEISDEGGIVANRMWSFISGQSEKMATWIRSQLGD